MMTALLSPQLVKGNELATIRDVNITSNGLNSSLILENYIINFTKLQVHNFSIAFENLTYIHPLTLCGARTNYTLFNFTTTNNISDLPHEFCPDEEAPAYYNISEYPPNGTNVTFSDSLWEFNVTWTDNGTESGTGQVDSVWIVFDDVNYTLEVYNETDVYIFNRSRLGRGDHNYSWWANDTSGNLNTTGILTYYADVPSAWELAVIAGLLETGAMMIYVGYGLKRDKRLLKPIFYGYGIFPLFAGLGFPLWHKGLNTEITNSSVIIFSTAMYMFTFVALFYATMYMIRMVKYVQKK